jgi:hypothetical protein
MELLNKVNKFYTLEYISKNNIAVKINNLEQFENIRNKIIKIDENSNISEWNLEFFWDEYKDITYIDIDINSFGNYYVSFCDDKYYIENNYILIEEDNVII